MLSFYYYREEGNSLPVVSGRSLLLLQRGLLLDGDARYLCPLCLFLPVLPQAWVCKDDGDALC
jgi:hypothetical protein